MFNSYQGIEAFFAKARCKADGRPVGIAGYRVFHRGTDYAIEDWSGRECCRIRSDNTLVLTANATDFWRFRLALPRFSPLVVTRAMARKYRVRCTNTHADYGYFPGITFDLTTGKCINPRPDMKPVIDPDKQREWRRALTRSRAVLKAKFLMGGGMASYLEYISAPGSVRASEYHIPYLQQQHLAYIVACMKADEYPGDLLRIITFHLSLPYVHIHDAQMGRVLAAGVDRIFRKYSVPLRREFGVIIGTAEDEVAP